MLNGDVYTLGGRVRHSFVETAPDFSPIALHFRKGRPIGGLVVWRLAGLGVDAEFEELVECRVKGWDVESAPANLVPIECLQVSQVKNETVALITGRS